MIKKKPERAHANLKMLEFVAGKLGVLNDEVVYLGGCATALFISDPLSLDVRPISNNSARSCIRWPRNFSTRSDSNGSC